MMRRRLKESHVYLLNCPLPLLTQLSICANMVSREFREEEKEEKREIPRENA
jgi:hypothetical protein